MKKFLLALVGSFTIFPVFAGTQIIIKFKPSESIQKSFQSGNISKQQLQRLQMQPLTSKTIQKLDLLTGLELKDIRAAAVGGRVLDTGTVLSKDKLDNLLSILNKQSDVEYAEENLIMHPTVSVPNIYQWDMYTSTNNVPGALTTYYGDSFYNGSNFISSSGNGVVVAVIDTGYVPHPNIINNLLTLSSISESYGYTFITDCRRAGTCPFSTPDNLAQIAPFPNGLDLGDWMTLTEYNSAVPSWQQQCRGIDGLPAITNSSWHGTHVTGTVVAEGPINPALVNTGILGGAYSAKVVPVRVLGKCGGSSVDIQDGMLWAGGLHPTITNSHPAKVINLSLGGYGTCPNSYQEVINQLVAAGVSVVVSAGNDSLNVSGAVPANCANVISVAANGPNQKLASYSNWGNVTIAASGGEEYSNYTTQYPVKAILSTTYDSTEGYGSNAVGCSGNSCFTYGWKQGTSMAAPHVAAAIADLLAVEPGLAPAQITEILQNSASSFDSCNAAGCISSGRLNAAAALQYINESVLMLTANPAALDNFSLGSSSVTLVNNNSESVAIGSIQISGVNSTNYSVSSNSTCISGLALNTGLSCAVTILTNSMQPGNTYFADLAVTNQAGQTIATIPLSYTMPNQSTSSGSGGCSFVGGGDDFSMQLLFGGLATIYWLRRKKA
ncbi:S8 family serine peptidase [Aquella oligotrophica]|nr:S8 family serine peptidase [Aquella oligotrophica]